MADALFAAPPRRRGRTEAAVERQLASWRAAGHLVGDDHAAHRRLLRGLAETVDAADRDHAAGDLTAMSRARVHTMLLEALAMLQPSTPPPVNAFDQAFAQLLAEAEADAATG